MPDEVVKGTDLRGVRMVNHWVKEGELDRFCAEKARERAGMAPYAARATKQTLNKILKRQAEEVLDIGLGWEWLSMRQDDHHEAATAFVEKREAHFTGH